MNTWLRKLSIYRSTQDVPKEYRVIFNHLYWDVTWWGVLSGTTIGFLVIYATRIGATGEQIGLINAGPAIVNLLLALPAGIWLGKLPIDRAVFWSGMLQRLFYLVFAFLPFLIFPQRQIWVIIVASLLMSIPGTGIAIGFNALFAEVVPPDWRGHVVGIRNALLSVTTVISALLAGQILTRLVFPLGYQVVFILGFIGAILSCLHLGMIHPLRKPAAQQEERTTEGTITGPASVLQSDTGFFPGIIRSFRGLRFDILKGKFGTVILLLFFFHFAQNIAIPVFPIYTVNVLHFSDIVLSLGSGIYSTAVFLGSMQFARVSKKFGNKKTIGFGFILMATYPTFIGLSHGVFLYFVASVTGGIAWAMAFGALFNYLLEYIPPSELAPHLSWYTLAFNAAVLLGSFIGPAIATLTGPSTSLFIFAVLRGLAGLAILRWG
jgi:MFS family permease